MQWRSDTLADFCSSSISLCMTQMEQEEHTDLKAFSTSSACSSLNAFFTFFFKKSRFQLSLTTSPQWFPLVMAMVCRVLQLWPLPSTWVYWVQGAVLLVSLPSGFFLPQASNKTPKYSEEQPPCLVCQDLEAHCSLWFWFITGVFGMKPWSLPAIVCSILPCMPNHNIHYFFNCFLLL